MKFDYEDLLLLDGVSDKLKGFDYLVEACRRVEHGAKVDADLWYKLACVYKTSPPTIRVRIRYVLEHYAKSAKIPDGPYERIIEDYINKMVNKRKGGKAF